MMNDVFEVTIIDDNHLGNGIAKKDNYTVFVHHTVKGDVVKVRITKVTKNIIYADLISFISKSSNHVEVKCPYYEECGGCDLLHVSYEREKNLKEEYIRKLFNDFDKSIVSFDRTGYRNKVVLHVFGGKLGFYKANTNSLIPIDNCLLLQPNINDFITKLKMINLSNIDSLTIKNGDNGLLLSIDGSLDNSDLNELIKYKKLKSIYVNNKLLYGDKYIKIAFDDKKYSINDGAFFQVNNSCALALYDKVKDLTLKCDNLLDLYCGTGSIGIYLSENIKNITGVEINEDSVICAKVNMTDNNITNYEIINSDAAFINGDFDAVIVDPPRAGLSMKVIDILNEMNTDKLIYISCNPSTLKRDVNLLVNYFIKDINVFNMFPATKHIETLVLLERKS